MHHQPTTKALAGIAALSALGGFCFPWSVHAQSVVPVNDTPASPSLALPSAVPVVPANLPEQAAVQQMAEQWRSKYHLPGVWCAYIKDGKIVACVADGVKNIETKAPASIDDHLNVGSVSKPITGTICAYFLNNHVISLNTTVSDVFPDLARRYPDSPLLKVTYEQLQNHTAGLPISTSIRWPTNPKNGVEWRLGGLIACLNSPAQSQPGEKYEYTNVGSNIAVAMIERLTGQSFESWLSVPIGRSLGIADAQMLDYIRLASASEISPHYIKNGIISVSKKTGVKGFEYATGGSIGVTVSDMARFLCLTCIGGMYSDAVYKSIIHHGENVVTRDTAASWHVTQAQTYLFHEGETGRGEFAYAVASPNLKRAFFFYTNASSDPYDPASVTVVNTMNGLIEKDIAVKFGIIRWLWVFERCRVD